MADHGSGEGGAYLGRDRRGAGPVQAAGQEFVCEVSHAGDTTHPPVDSRDVFGDLPTPVLVVDVDVFDANVVRMARRAERLGVGLRPHAKTVKSPQLMERVVAAGVIGLTVSTLGEVATLAHLVDDLLLAVPVAAGKAAHVLAALGDREVRLTLIVDDPAGLEGVPDDSRISVAIEIDSDGVRGGVRADDPALLELAERVAERSVLRGVMTHHGGSYSGTPTDVPSAAARERDAVVAAADRLRNAGHRIDMVSVGSTPTASVAADLAGVTEMRPGVYLFGDRSMVALGACDPGDVAATVISTVIGHTRAGAALIDAGWAALGRDAGVPAIGPDPGLGALVESGTVVSSATQEHGVVGSGRLAVGDRVRIAPNHACATAEMHDELVLVRGGEVVGRVRRPRGWWAS